VVDPRVAVVVMTHNRVEELLETLVRLARLPEQVEQLINPPRDTSSNSAASAAWAWGISTSASSAEPTNTKDGAAESAIPPPWVSRDVASQRATSRATSAATLVPELSGNPRRLTSGEGGLHGAVGSTARDRACSAHSALRWPVDRDAAEPPRPGTGVGHQGFGWRPACRLLPIESLSWEPRRTTPPPRTA
jgi:hypothetical protein